MNTLRKKAAINKYHPMVNEGTTKSELTEQLKADDYQENEIAEIVAEFFQPDEAPGGDRPDIPAPTTSTEPAPAPKTEAATAGQDLTAGTGTIPTPTAPATVKTSVKKQYEEWKVDIDAATGKLTKVRKLKTISLEEDRAERLNLHTNTSKVKYYLVS